MPSARWLALISMLAGCSPGYQPGNLIAPNAIGDGQGVTVDCLDIAVDLGSDPKVREDHPVVEISFANRCEVPVKVDLTRMKVTARYPDGTLHELTPYDPWSSIRPGVLDPLMVGQEAIEYRPRDDEAASPIAVCVEVATLGGKEGQGGGKPLCFDHYHPYQGQFKRALQ